jgi:hypothetical protein
MPHLQAKVTHPTDAGAADCATAAAKGALYRQQWCKV